MNAFAQVRRYSQRDRRSARLQSVARRSESEIDRRPSPGADRYGHWFCSFKQGVLPARQIHDGEVASLIRGDAPSGRDVLWSAGNIAEEGWEGISIN
jgi:hypothetical protein